MAACRRKARSVKMAAIHMKTNILIPMFALMLSWSCAVRASLAATLMVVAIAAARVTRIAEIAERMERSRLHQRVRITSKLNGMRTKLTTIPAMKQPYMILEPILRRLRTVTASAGRAIWAPASSSLTRISTGLNQYHCLVGEQYVTPLEKLVSNNMRHR